MPVSKAKLKTALRMIKRPPRQVLVLGSLVLVVSVAILLGGGSFSAVAVLMGLSLPPALIVPAVWRIIMGKEFLSDLGDFRQERLLPLMEKLKSWGVETTILTLSSDLKGKFKPLVSFKTFESLALLRLRSHAVDLIHIGYWTDEKFSIEAFYLDLVAECEVKAESGITTELQMMKRFILFGGRRFEWWGGELAQWLNQDEGLKENLPIVSAIMEMPALWVVPSAKEGLVRIHIPYVKRVDADQFSSILMVAERIAQHVKSLA